VTPAPKAPRVTLYDGALQKRAVVSTAARINRSWTLDEPGLLEFQCDADERLLPSMSPLDGRLAVVESEFYPYPWVGKITSLRRNRADGSVQVSAEGFERIFEHRFSGASVPLSGGTGEVARKILMAINAQNPTGIDPGDFAETGASGSTTLTYANGREALDTMAELAGCEWWVEPTIRKTGLGLRLNFRQARGFDRISDVALVDGGTCAWEDWTMDGEAVTYGLTVLGGQASASQSLADRAAARADPATVRLAGPHGYLPFGPVEAANLLTRQERFALSQQLRSDGQLRAAAEAMLARQRTGGVPLSVRLSVPLDADRWALLDVGTVFRLVLPSAFLAGYDGPARILGAQPMEEDGDMQLTVQLLRAKA